MSEKEFTQGLYDWLLICEQAGDFSEWNSWVDEIVEKRKARFASLAPGETCDIPEINLRGAPLAKRNLKGINLLCTNLEGADLRGAHLEKANLSGANLREAHLEEANLSRADISGADFKEEDLKGAINAEKIIRK